MALGIAERDARRLERGILAGGTLVTVNAGPRAGEALVLLRENGAEVGSQAVDAADEPGRERRNPARPGRRRTDMQQA